MHWMELLDVLKTQMNCEYISDLPRLQRPNAELQRVVRELPLAAFPAREWIEAFAYLCAETPDSAEDARNALLSL